MTAKRPLPLNQVRMLPYYGRHFPFIPWTLKSKLRVSFVFARTLFHELRLAKFVAFCLRLPFRLIPTYRELRRGFRLMRSQFGLMAEIEWILLVMIYKDLEKTHGKTKAYAFAKSAIQKSSRFMMNDFYQADRLEGFEDPFEAFWSYHKAMFQNDPNYENELIDNGNLKVMIVHRCRNCEIAQLTVPELAPIGCDHDITGYKAIEDKTDMEFRRPETLAKDGKPCRFMFYHKGTAPKDDHEIH